MNSTTIDQNPPGRSGDAGGRKGPLDQLLGIFADVRGGEGFTAVLLMLNIFLLLASYNLLKTIREPLILAGDGGAEVKSYAAAAIAGLLVILVPAYSALASRVSRVKLINGVTLIFILCLVAFFVLNRAGVPVGVPFFIWVGIFNVMMIAQLWAFANDVYTVEQGKRLFAIVGFGASLGAIAGSFATGQLVKDYGPYPFMLAAAALLGVCMVLTNLVHVREKVHAGDRAAAAADPDRKGMEKDGAGKDGEAIGGKNGFALVLSDKYLLMIGLLMLLVNLVNTTGEYILGKTVVDLYAAGSGAAGGVDEKRVIGEFYGNYFTLVNIISAVLQAFVVSRVIKYFGVRTALMVLPVVAFAGYTAMAFIPVLSFIRGVKLAENSLDYSLQNTTRNALYLPTSREAKYKAKQANDTFFVRAGDVLSAGLVFAGTTWLDFAAKQFALVNAALVLVWLGLAFALGLAFKRLAKTD
jgi:AAA family ATP:ADP antiporter